MTPFWTVCYHCKKPQKTLAKIYNQKKCVYCGRTFKVKKIPTPKHPNPFIRTYGRLDGNEIG